MRQARTFIFLLIIVTVLSSGAMAAERGKAPRFDGESFAGVVGPGVDTQAILNVTQETVALYLYFPKEDLLRQLWSVPAKSVRTEDGWQVVLPEKNVAFHLASPPMATCLSTARPNGCGRWSHATSRGCRSKRSARTAAAADWRRRRRRATSAAHRSATLRASSCATVVWP